MNRMEATSHLDHQTSASSGPNWDHELLQHPLQQIADRKEDKMTIDLTPAPFSFPSLKALSKPFPPYQSTEHIGPGEGVPIIVIKD